MNTNRNLLLPKLPTHNLEYWVGNKLVETIMYDKPISQCISFGKSLKQDSKYKLGTFKHPKS